MEQEWCLNPAEVLAARCHYTMSMLTGGEMTKNFRLSEHRAAAVAARKDFYFDYSRRQPGAVETTT